MIKNGKLSNFLDFAKSQSDRGAKRRREEKRVEITDDSPFLISAFSIFISLCSLKTR